VEFGIVGIPFLLFKKKKKRVQFDLIF